MYYCGDANDGKRVTNDWRYLYIGDSDCVADTEDDTVWFFFGADAKKVVTDAAWNAGKTPDEHSYRTKKINGKVYAFDEDGKMITKWSEGTATVATRIDGYFVADQGARQKGWFQAVPAKNINTQDNADEVTHWYYANNNGTLITSELKSLSGKKYAFNEKGDMLTGLWALSVDAENKFSAKSVEISTESQVTKLAATVKNAEKEASGEKYSIYYFGENGSMKTGTQSVEVDGERYQFTFGKTGGEKGKGINKVQNNVLYVYGKKIKADSDYKYQAVNADGEVVTTIRSNLEADGTITDARYLINTSGSVMRNDTTYVDYDGRKYTVSKRIVDGVKDGTYVVKYNGIKNETVSKFV